MMLANSCRSKDYRHEFQSRAEERKWKLHYLANENHMLAILMTGQAQWWTDFCKATSRQPPSWQKPSSQPTLILYKSHKCSSQGRLDECARSTNLTGTPSREEGGNNELIWHTAHGKLYPKMVLICLIVYLSLDALWLRKGSPDLHWLYVGKHTTKAPPRTPVLNQRSMPHQRGRKGLHLQY